jgi:hypothetical protein
MEFQCRQFLLDLNNLGIAWSINYTKTKTAAAVVVAATIITTSTIFLFFSL